MIESTQVALYPMAMARVNDESKLVGVFNPHLRPGERVVKLAYGVKQPSLLIIIPLLALALLPGIIVQAMMTKEYLIGLTDQGRLVVLQIDGKGRVRSSHDYAIATIGKVESSVGPVFARLKIADPKQPFTAKFHRMGLRNNRENVQAIAQALTQRQLTAA